MTLRVVLADDQALVLHGLRTILEAEPDITVVGEAPDGRRAVELARTLRPDVCLFDVRMPVMDGIEATRQVTALADAPAVVVLTTFDLDEYIYGALQAGARGFLLKDAGPSLLVAAVRAAEKGEALVSPSVTARLLARFSRGSTPRSAREPLTEREEEVLLTIARGLTNQEIARSLHISLSTVKTHVAALMTKLDARNRVEIAIWAYESGRVVPG